MKARLLVCIVTTMFLFVMTTVANASTIVDLYGDEDGLGLGLTNGQSFNYAAVTFESDDEGITDRWVSGSQAWTQIYDLTGLGAITSASMEIATGGQGWNGLTQILIDGQLIGTLTDGDDVGSGYNYYFVDTFDLMPFSAYLDGASTLTTIHASAGDGWALDYSKLTISDDGTAPVPEPATMLLLGSGLLGFAGFRKKSKK